MQDALTTFFSQFEPVPWLCYLFPVLALGILIRCAVSLLTFRPEPEVWAWLTTPDGAHIPVRHDHYRRTRRYDHGTDGSVVRATQGLF